MKKKKSPAAEVIVSSTQEAVPVPLLFGTRRIPVVWINRPSIYGRKAPQEAGGKK